MGKHNSRTVRRQNWDLTDLSREIGEHDGPVLMVAADGLHSLLTRPRLSEYIVQLWGRRYFIWADARAKALRSTRSYRLWRLWLVVNPLLNVVFYGFLFGVLFRTSRGVDNFIGFLFIGTIFMGMITGLMSTGNGLISASRSMIRAFQFPRAALPFSQTLRASIDNLIPAIMAIIAAFLLQWGKPPGWMLILVVPLYLMIHLFGSGLMMILARITAQIPDVKAIIPLITQAWFFLSGVMFTLDRFQHVPVIQKFMSHNPAYLFLNAIRDVTIYTRVPSISVWITLALWTLLTFCIGFLVFWQAEDKYVRLA